MLLESLNIPVTPETQHFKPFFEKKLHFQAQFSLILAKFQLPETQIVVKICSGDPYFQAKKQFRWPYFWKPGRYMPIQNIPQGLTLSS